MGLGAPHMSKSQGQPSCFLLGMIANSILNQLDLNGKGIATRSSAMDPSWQIAGDISNGIRGFINVFAMKKLLLKLFPSSSTLL